MKCFVYGLVISNKMKKAIRMYISGLVQGVFFRNFVKENADNLNLKGFVRNLEDGRVEIFAEGNPEDIEKMIAICRQGQKFSKVAGVEVKDERFQDLKDFKILHI